ncbi:MAG TPA: c-type cytochrome [Noviherbaspirillum sp.]|jgi:cytochrome c553|uniref:c-type cytochrome n=1 Tax=Noviherbaspirillum sp. TaxID=1926288 RepID=UPI002DDD609B|nr:c-type cytochrome [Noviherbaspirillum sp.]HEV2610386.1 c-type cytochrome [Noviherbaspirillum sp.]
MVKFRKSRATQFIRFTFGALILIHATTLTLAAEPDPTGRRLYATCAACHGTDGRPERGGSLSALAGQSKESLTAAMQAFKTGTRNATIMHQIAKGYTDEQIELIAGYLAGLNKPESK